MEVLNTNTGGKVNNSESKDSKCAHKRNISLAESYSMVNLKIKKPPSLYSIDRKKYLQQHFVLLFTKEF